MTQEAERNPAPPGIGQPGTGQPGTGQPGTGQQSGGAVRGSGTGRGRVAGHPARKPQGRPSLGGGVPAQDRELRAQGRETVRKLLDAGLVEFEERGFNGVRVDDLVRRAGISHGTFYLYFSNKEEVLRALVGEAGHDARNLADVLSRPPALGGTPQWDDVRLWVSTYSDLWFRYGALFQAWTDLARVDPELTEVLGQTWAIMSKALSRHIEPGDVDPQVAAMAVLAMLDRFHSVREFTGQPIDEAALDTVATMIHRSL
jgi:AcrR family transcriptional regulator